MINEEREDAINFFKEVAKREVGTYCKLAIEALESKEKTEWIPVSERLPELNKDVLVCVIYKKYEPQIYTGYLRKDIYDEGYNTWWSRSRGEVSFPIVHDVVAWMSLPKPYKPQDSNDKEVSE